jgi:cytoskeletal protein RodZ
VFEIGNSLREARVRRGVDFAQAELGTKIRGKYLRALEEEQFSLLPAQTYVKGFLRTYAEYLGLDGQLYVDEYNSRFVTGADDHEPRIRRSHARPQRRTRHLETNVVLVVLAAIAVVTVIVISAWKASGGGDHATPPTAGRAPSTSTTSRVPPPLLAVKATEGSAHVIARRSTATGDVVFDGTVSKGDKTVAIRGRLLWVSISSPDNLHIEVRGHVVHIPGSKPQVVFVTPTGWRPASQ